ncbi:endoplasmic reticulum retention protein [Microbotryomycetes sp. JL201]|nr:endoplasmic reticulum retention protein [Microbotryomycetes sp. JL201]
MLTCAHSISLHRLLGDLSHLASILILLHKIQKSRSARGISFKTQMIYLVVFCTRYVDLLTGPYISLYNTLMKIFFIASSGYIVYLMKVKFRPTQDPAIDTLKLEYLVGPTISEILWSFSIYLEAVGILPQLFMLQRTGEAETITTHYLFALGAYRALYVPNWVYRYFTEDTVDPIAIIAGLVQTALFSDFFYIYFTKVMRGQKFELPA